MNLPWTGTKVLYKRIKKKKIISSSKKDYSFLRRVRDARIQTTCYCISCFTYWIVSPTALRCGDLKKKKKSESCHSFYSLYTRCCQRRFWEVLKLNATNILVTSGLSGPSSDKCNYFWVSNWENLDKKSRLASVPWRQDEYTKQLHTNKSMNVLTRLLGIPLIYLS